MDIFKDMSFLALIDIVDDDDLNVQGRNDEIRVNNGGESPLDGLIDHLMKWWVGDFSDETWEILLNNGLISE